MKLCVVCVSVIVTAHIWFSIVIILLHIIFIVIVDYCYCETEKAIFYSTYVGTRVDTKLLLSRSLVMVVVLCLSHCSVRYR